MSEAMTIRLEMQALGWSSEDKLSDRGWGGKHGYTIWFRRDDWHGKSTWKLIGSEASYFSSTGDLSKIDEAVKHAADKARKAYSEFIEYPPQIMADGTMSDALGRMLADRRLYS